MDIHDVRKRLEDICSYADDCETAHGLEDDLYRTVLTAIADGVAAQPQLMAFEALRSAEIDFARWYA